MTKGNPEMDLANAALLIGAVYGITELIEALFGSVINTSARKAALAVGDSFGATFLVGATTWAHSQVIGNVPLDRMSVADKVLVSIFVAGAAALTQRAVKTVSNIGVPMPSAAQREALDTGAAKSLELWAELQHPDTSKAQTPPPPAA